MCPPLLLSNCSTYVFLIFFLFLCACFVCLLHILCILLLYWFVYYFSFSIYVCPFSIFFLQVYRPLPPGGNPIAFNKYHIRKCIKKFPDYFTQTANRWHHVNVCAMIESWSRRHILCKVTSLCERW